MCRERVEWAEEIPEKGWHERMNDYFELNCGLNAYAMGIRHAPDGTLIFPKVEIAPGMSERYDACFGDVLGLPPLRNRLEDQRSITVPIEEGR